MSGLKRIRRTPIKFDLFNAFAQEGEASFDSSDKIDNFMSRARASLADSLKDERFLHGQRTQSMFESIVVALGNVRLIKTEDAGGGWYEGDCLSIPDFRVVMGSGEQLLIEVKNHFSQPLERPLVLTAAYFESLKKYGEMVGVGVYLAVYYPLINAWAVAPLETCVKVGNKYELRFVDAMKANILVSFGDKMIGTTPPLECHWLADLAKPRSCDGNTARFTIGGLKYVCAGREIVNKTAQGIALMLMMFSRWDDESEELVFDEDGLPLRVEYKHYREDQADQGFVILDSLSGLYSQYFRLQTLNEDGDVSRLNASVTPGSFGKLIPDGFKDDALPLWIFRINPH